MLAFDINDVRRDYTVFLYFYVLKLKGVDLAVGQILIQVPSLMVSLIMRKFISIRKVNVNAHQMVSDGIGVVQGEA